MVTTGAGLACTGGVAGVNNLLGDGVLIPNLFGVGEAITPGKLYDPGDLGIVVLATWGRWWSLHWGEFLLQWGQLFNRNLSRSIKNGVNAKDSFGRNLQKVITFLFILVTDLIFILLFWHPEIHVFPANAYFGSWKNPRYGKRALVETDSYVSTY